MSTFVARHGSIVYFNLSQETYPDVLQQALKQAGFRERQVRYRTPLQSLKAALGDIFPTMMLRSLADAKKNGYTVIDEDKGEEENDFSRVCNVSVDKDCKVDVTHCVPAVNPISVGAQIQSRVDHYHSVLTASATSDVAVSIVKIELQGITLKDRGGLYFVADEHSAELELLCQAVEKAAVVPGTNRMGRSKLEMNEATLRDLKTSLVQEIEQDTEQIMDELKNGDFGDRGADFRVDKMTEKINRLEFWEKELGEPQGLCRSAINKCLTALSAFTAARDDDKVFDEMYG